jgi:hypothetical protein
MSVKVAPASVEYSNFRGGVIEFVTKGGTNEFEGSVAYYDRGDSFYGDKIEGREYTFDKEDTAESFTFGGPIIKDKAFFYVTYEDTLVTNPVLYGPAGSGAANEQVITQAQVDNIRNITKNKYGWDPLGVASKTESKQENTSIRIDYIVNDNHRLNYNYKLTEGDRLRASGSNSEFYFESASYFKGDDVTYDEFKQVYVDAWKGNAKGCTTFRLSGKRFGILNNETLEEKETILSETQEVAQEEGKAEACFFDPITGQKECA